MPQGGQGEQDWFGHQGEGPGVPTFDGGCLQLERLAGKHYLLNGDPRFQRFSLEGLPRYLPGAVATLPNIAPRAHLLSQQIVTGCVPNQAFSRLSLPSEPLSLKAKNKQTSAA